MDLHFSSIDVVSAIRTKKKRREKQSNKREREREKEKIEKKNSFQHVKIL